MEDSVIRAAEISLGGIFVVAGFAKQRVNSARASGLALAELKRRISYGISLGVLSQVWRIVGGIEVITGAALLVPVFGQRSALAASVLLAVGLVYLIVAHRVAPGGACGCFGTGGRITTLTMIRCAYALGWASYLAAQPGDGTQSMHDSVVGTLGFAAAIALPIVATSLAWRDITRAAQQRWSQLGSFVRARLASPQAVLDEIRASDVWHAMAEDSGATGLEQLATIDTWMEGNWRIWELSEAHAPSGIHLIAGRYLGTKSELTRLMLFDGLVKSDKYIGTWDSRLIGLNAPDPDVDRMVVLDGSANGLVV